MLTPEQIKGRIKNIAEKKDLRPQEVLQMFLFERVLERLSASEYKSNFILKGGLLISSMIGISERTTMDMDTTVRGIQMEEDEIVEIVKKIIAIDVDDGIQFEFQRIEPIREDDAYNNFRIHLIAKYGMLLLSFKKSWKSFPYKGFRVFHVRKFSISYYHYPAIARKKYFVFQMV